MSWTQDISWEEIMVNRLTEAVYLMQHLWLSSTFAAPGLVPINLDQLVACFLRGLAESVGLDCMAISLHKIIRSIAFQSCTLSVDGHWNEGRSANQSIERSYTPLSWLWQLELWRVARDKCRAINRSNLGAVAGVPIRASSMGTLERIAARHGKALKLDKGQKIKVLRAQPCTDKCYLSMQIIQMRSCVRKLTVRIFKVVEHSI